MKIKTIELTGEQVADELNRLYNTIAALEQPVFTVGTDLSDGELSVVVMKHENDTTWVIHSEVIQLSEQQPDVTQLVDADDYKTWYEDAIARSNEAGFTGMSAAQVIDYQDNEIMQLQSSNTRLVEALVAVKARLNGEYDHPALVKQGPLGRFSDDVERIIDSVLSAHHKQEVNHDNQ